MIKSTTRDDLDKLQIAVQELSDYLEKANNKKYIHTLVLRSLIDEIQNEFNDYVRKSEDTTEEQIMNKDYVVRIENGIPVKIYSNGMVIPATRKDVYETNDPYLIDKFEELYQRLKDFIGE